VKRVGLVDIAVVIVLLLAVVMPPREMVASAGIRGNVQQQFALGLAEAKTIAVPSDGAARAVLARALDEAHQNDWAIEEAARGATVATTATKWQPLLAESVGYVDRLDAKAAYANGKQALDACDASTCPGYERARMEIYLDHLNAGIRSGIDPRVDPAGFRAAGDRGIHEVRIHGHDDQQPVPPPKPKPPADNGSAP
jgi:hypothetical protein